MPASTFFRAYTLQATALSSSVNRPAGVVGRLLWAHDRSQLRSILHDYASIQFNRRFDSTFDIVTREMPKSDIFVRTARTRQRIAMQLARESELATTLPPPPTADPNSFNPALQDSLQLYRHHLATFANKPLEYITEAAHKLN